MTIDRINNLEPLQPGKKTGRSGLAEKGKEADSISLSSEAVEKAELYRTMDLASAAEDVRAERVAELKAKINDPSYINATIIQATADKIMDAFGL
ncbi:MAG: flagellar biosynthesis anti-sigma factor FlgM [Spirochaetaceae bacterium]|jgi:negative regulator of flagellin synthesis FlgM|nr:flagellar biosynthesis anti-sigma factor FlgM [Spirochaetaceae bacterium]